IRRLGDVLNAGKGYLTSLGYSAADLGQEMTLYNLLGDPTVTFRVSGPPPFVVLDPAIFNGVLVATIPRPPIPQPCLRCPPPLDLAQIVLVVQDAQGNVLGRGLASADGNVSIPLDNLGARELLLTASTEDTIPVQTKIQTAPTGSQSP